MDIRENKGLTFLGLIFLRFCSMDVICTLHVPRKYLITCLQGLTRSLRGPYKDLIRSYEDLISSYKDLVRSVLELRRTADGRSVSRSARRSVNRSVSRLVGLSVGRSPCRSVETPTFTHNTVVYITCNGTSKTRSLAPA